MSTRCTIRFSDGDEEFFVYRHCDGYPENILPDIEAVIEKSKGRWSGGEAGILVSMFLADNFDSDKKRLPEYWMTSGHHGDESYLYDVVWNDDLSQWEIGDVR